MNKKLSVLILLICICCFKSAYCSLIFNNADGLLESIEFTEDMTFDVIRGGPEELAVTLIIRDVFESPTFYSTRFNTVDVHLLGNTESHISGQLTSTASWFSLLYDDDGDGIIHWNIPADMDTHDLYINFGFENIDNPGSLESFFNFAEGDTFTIKQGGIIQVPGTPDIPFPDQIKGEVEVQLVSTLYSIEYTDRYSVAVVPEPSEFASLLSCIVLILLLKNKRRSRLSY